MAAGLPDLAPNERLLPTEARFLPPVVPSKHNSWRAVRGEAQRYTECQLRALRERGVDPATVEDVLVRQPISSREFVMPMIKNPTYVMPCPILRRSPQLGELLVIAPAGDLRWVTADGRITNRKVWGRA